MCDFCEQEKIILEQEDNISLSAWNYGWSGTDYKITESEAENNTYQLSLFIDRGYIRLANLEDSGCLDHGLKMKIKYCPFCGDEVKQL